ncbi:unnamed protein product [Brachionus calyciflorus]|uniref:Methyltransferase type 11 domain-containing protein n=1 Tax=Brachionus calyciflorus TaxID=104777 RepID=A0A814LA53_9BILA|nr:unnamed protein product [Brachionus calyciflorus]
MKNLIINLFKKSNFRFQTYRNLSINKNEDNMSKKAFWDKFYSKHTTKTFEWLIEFNDSLKSLSQNLISLTNGEKPTLLLDVGCGTSQFSQDLKNTLDSSFLICTDFSYKALDLLKSKNSSLQTIDYVECNCKYLPFRSTVCDLIIDKGFSDSLLKETNTRKSLQQTLKSINNQLETLQQNGVLIQITDEEPELRISSLFDQLNIQYNFKEINLDSGSNYFVYFIKKK